MLPRGAELVRLLPLRQQLVQRYGHKIHCRWHVHAAKQLSSPLRVFDSGLRLTLRQYSSKDTKMQTMPAAAKASTSATEPKITTKTKTTQNTATEPKTMQMKPTSSKLISKTTTPTAAKVELVKPPTDSILSEQPKQAPHLQPNVTTKLEIETSKGILSVTTTIEDSKINDIVLEKTVKPQVVIPAATISAEEVEKLAKAQLAAKQTADELATAAPKSGEKPEASAASPLADINAIPMPKGSETLRDSLKATAALTAAAAAAKSKPAAAQAAPTAKETAPLAAESKKPKAKARLKVDFNRSSLERNFITPSRAMSDFLLKPSDLESLSKIKRRSPYEQEPPITVFWRKDVEAKAIEVWGSSENLLRETLKREIERKKHQQNLFTVKRRLRDYRREIGSRTEVLEEPGLKGKSGKVVLIAIGINGINFLFKVCGWLYTGSHSMFSEAIHSLADTVNQLILAYGIHKSVQSADSYHPYGYANMKYVSSLISGVGIFCVGAGLSVYHGITGLMNPAEMEDFFWAFFILGGSLVSEGATLLVAINELKRSAKLKGISFKEYVLSGKDPCVNVVLTEDAAAVAGVTVAATCMGLTQITGSPIFDAVGSLLVGGILGAVASFIIYTNVQALVGRSIPEDLLNKINSELEADIMIRAIHDVKGIDMGNSLVRYKAEMDFDGRELTRFYLDKQDLNELLKVVKSFQTVEELETFLLAHGENIVDLMGGEIDRIEMKLRKKFPEIRHCDLEIL